MEQFNWLEFVPHGLEELLNDGVSIVNLVIGLISTQVCASDSGVFWATEFNMRAPEIYKGLHGKSLLWG